jgi:hypothetical protein
MFDVDAMHLDADLVPELVVLADGGLYSAVLDPAARTYAEPVSLLALERFGDGAMRVGDVNADGIDDVTWTDGPNVEVFVGFAAEPLGGSSAIAPLVEEQQP